MDAFDHMNPTREIRYQLLKRALTAFKRREDARAILDAAAMPLPITTIAPPNRFPHVSIGIIGAGLAGLSAAYELSILGCQITLFEANGSRVGGRVYSHHFSDEHHGEWGALRIPVSHEATWHYIERFRLNTLPLNANPFNSHLYIKGVHLPRKKAQTEALLSLYPLFDLNEWERRTPLSKLQEYALNQALIHLSPFERDQLLQIQPRYSPTIDYLDSINAYQAFHHLGFSEPGIDLLQRSLDFDRDYLYHSYLALLKEVYAAHFHFTYRIENGNSQLPLAFYKALTQKPNVAFKLGHRVTGIYLDHHTFNPILRFQHQNSESFQSFDFIICAIPFSRLRLMEIQPPFSFLKMQAIRNIHYTPALTTLIFYKTPLGNRFEHHGHLVTDRPIGSPWLFSNNSERGVFIAQAFGEDAIRLGGISEEERTVLIKQELQKMFGLSESECEKQILEIKTMNWHQHPYHLGAFGWYLPEQTRLYAYASQTPEYNGRVFFAGEHTSAYSAWMQGALQSGASVANQIATELVSNGLFIPSY